MRTIELLAPAGDQESLIAAVQNGANAVYLGGSLFNARAFAKNFDNEQLVWAVEYTHLRHVKIYVTVNTLYQDSEFDELIKYVDFLYDIQVDALIVQDIGFFSIIKQRYPDFELHISTQASVMNSSGVKYFEDLKASRVVLARENTITEIETICKSTSLEIEVFVHGAICISYSGQCLMSSLIGQRSGNRGACAQPCRLQYRLQQDGQILENTTPFILSPKDMMTLEKVGELIDAGVTSFKIEGRMKRPEYVASVVKAYRRAIDSYLDNEYYDNKEDISNMRAMFNRNYTKGYAFFDTHLVDGDYSGNKGVIIGEVLRYDQKRKVVVCHLKETLKQGDSVVFEDIDKGRPVNKIYLKNKLVSHANKDDDIEIEFDYPVFQGNIRKTVDITVIHSLRKTYQKEVRKELIEIDFVAQVGQKASLVIRYLDYYIKKESKSNVEEAIYVSLDKSRIEEQLRKLGSTSFVASRVQISVDNNITIPIKELNELRRDAIEELNLQIKNKKIHLEEKNSVKKLENIDYTGNHKIYVIVNTLDQLRAALEQGIENIYYTFHDNLSEAYQLCLEYQISMGLYIPRICKDDDLKQISQHPQFKDIKKVIVNDFGSYLLCRDKEKIIGTGMNIYNSYASSFYNEPKVLSLELSKKQIQNMMTNHGQCFMQVYGKIESMISEYCPISQYYFGYQKKNCGLCQKNKFSLIDRRGETYNLMMDEKCRMHLLNSKTLFIDDVKGLNVCGFFIHITNEEYTLTKSILNDFDSIINSSMKSQIKGDIDTTFGYYRK